MWCLWLILWQVAVSTDCFDSLWRTTKYNETIYLPISQSGAVNIYYDNISGTQELFHMFSTPGNYTIQICGDIQHWSFGDMSTSSNNLVMISAWGPSVELAPGAFKDCSLLISVPKESPKFETRLDSFFQGAKAFNAPLDWETSGVLSMAHMFDGATRFNSVLNFSTKNVQNLSFMFKDCYSLDVPINFNTSNALDMTGMFENAGQFTNGNQPLNFSVQKVVNVGSMFANASRFTQNLALWNTRNVVNCSNFCANCSMPLLGCFGVTCNVTGYKGPAGECSCASGYNGSVSYSSNKPFGCKRVCDLSSTYASGNACYCLNQNNSYNYLCLPRCTNTTFGNFQTSFQDNIQIDCGRSYFANNGTLLIGNNMWSSSQVTIHNDSKFDRTGAIALTSANVYHAVWSLSIEYFDSRNAYQKITGLSSPVVIRAFIRNFTGANRRICKNGYTLYPMKCYWRANEMDSWDSSVCTTGFNVSVNNTELTCNCTALGFIALTSVDDFPAPRMRSAAAVLVGVLLGVVFPLCLLMAVRRDKLEREYAATEASAVDKQKSASLCEAQIKGLREQHSLCCVARGGVWFKAIDRVFVSFFTIFVILVVVAAFVTGESELDNGIVVVIASAIAILPMYVLTHLITGENVQSKDDNKPAGFWGDSCPKRCRWAWYVFVVAGLVIASIFVIEVDSELCEDVTGEWLWGSFAAYALLALALEPFKIVMNVRVKHYSSMWVLAPAAQPAHNLVALTKAEGSPRVDLPTIDFKEVEVVEVLGQGAFGRVDQCVWRGADWAVKRLLNSGAEQEFLHEVSINSHLTFYKHSGVVGFVGLTENPRGMLLELYPLRSVEDYVILKGNLQAPSDLCNVLTILIGASAGVLHLHANGVVHRDLAARNFLVKHDLSAAVCDFGLALRLPEGKEVGERTLDERRKEMLPVNTSAPETLRCGHYSAKTDVYMFGHFIWELFARASPHCDHPSLRKRDMQTFLKHVCSGTLVLHTPTEWPTEISVLISRCSALDPAQRPTMMEINDTLRRFKKAVLAQPQLLPISQVGVVEKGETNLYDVSAYQDAVYESVYGYMSEQSSYGIYASPEI